MTDKTYTRALVCKGDIALGSGCMRCGRCAEQLAARVQELEDKIAAVGAGGVQTVSPEKVFPDACQQAQAAINSEASGGVQALGAAPAQSDGRKCYLCGHPASAHPMEPDPRGGMRRGGCPPGASPPAEQPASTPGAVTPEGSAITGAALGVQAAPRPRQGSRSSDLFPCPCCADG